MAHTGPINMAMQYGTSEINGELGTSKILTQPLKAFTVNQLEATFARIQGEFNGNTRHLTELFVMLVTTY